MTVHPPEPRGYPGNLGAPFGERAASPRTALIDLRGAGRAVGTPANVLRKILKLGTGSEVTPTTLGGLPAAVAETTLSGKPTRVTVVFLGKSAFAISQQANSAGAFRQHSATMDAATNSFHPITAGERALAKPLRMRVITASAGITFTELAKTSPLGRFSENHLRVLNNLYPHGEPAAGEPLKIVE